jgi:hypothetical protein
MQPLMVQRASRRTYNSLYRALLEEITAYEFGDNMEAVDVLGLLKLSEHVANYRSSIRVGFKLDSLCEVVTAVAASEQIGTPRITTIFLIGCCRLREIT